MSKRILLLCIVCLLLIVFIRLSNRDEPNVQEPVPAGTSSQTDTSSPTEAKSQDEELPAPADRDVNEESLAVESAEDAAIADEEAGADEGEEDVSGEEAENEASAETTPEPSSFRILGWYDGRWPHERSDIPPDAANRYGRLENGLRYVIRHHDVTKGRVSMQLDVQVGSLMEEPHERGFAHFVEHMAFNGTRKFGPGALIPLFQRHGMSFGGDTNAHTAQSETVYKLNLASPERIDIAQGLDVLRDFADGMLMIPAEVEEEKGVILAEKRSREKEVVLAGREWRKTLYGDSPLGQDIIGEEDTINAATSTDLLAFYRKWYRADRMMLVVVGDTDPDLVEEEIRKRFGDMAPPEGELPYPEIPDPLDIRNVVLVYGRPVDFVVTTVNFRHPMAHVEDTRANELQGLVDSVGKLCLETRLAQRSGEADSPWTMANARGNWRSGIAPIFSLTASSPPDQWKRAMDELSAEKAAVLAFGFSEEEVHNAVDQVRRVLKNRVTSEKRLSNDKLTAQMVSSINADNVLISPEYALERFDELKGGITKDAVNQAMKEAMSGELALFLSGDINATADEVDELWKSYEKREPVRKDEAAFTVLPYLTLPEVPETLPKLEERTLPMPEGGLKVFESTLAGGTKLVLAPIKDMDKSRVRVSLLFGPGLKNMTDEESRAARLAVNVLGYAGPGRLTSIERVRQLHSRGIGLDETITDFGTVLSGYAPADELATLLIALWTQFEDPLPTQVAQLRYNKVLEQYRARRATRFDTVDGMSEALRFAHFLGGRHMPLDAGTAATIPQSAVEERIAKSRENGIDTILISGDFEPDIVLAAMARLFGSIDHKETARDADFRSNVFPTEKKTVIEVGPELVNKAVVRMAFRADMDVADRGKLAARNVLAAVLRDRLRETLREGMGIAYSPFAVYRLQDEGFGFVLLEALTSRERAAETADVMRRIARELAEKGADQQDVNRMRKPMMTAWKTRNNEGRRVHMLIRSELLSGRPQMAWNEVYDKTLMSARAEPVSAEAREILGQEPFILIIEGGPLGQTEEEKRRIQSERNERMDAPESDAGASGGDAQ